MQTVFKAMTLSILVLALAACATLVPAPTPTATPTGTSLPTSTSTPEPTTTPTETPVPPTETPAEPVLPLPSGEPVSEWEGIPIMSEAIAGGGDSQGYTFTIDASVEEVQSFYETEMGKLGWDLLASGQGSTEAIIMIFIQAEAGTLSVSILPQQDGTLYVLLVK